MEIILTQDSYHGHAGRRMDVHPSIGTPLIARGMARENTPALPSAPKAPCKDCGKAKVKVAPPVLEKGPSGNYLLRIQRNEQLAARSKR